MLTIYISISVLYLYLYLYLYLIMQVCLFNVVIARNLFETRSLRGMAFTLGCGVSDKGATTGTRFVDLQEQQY